MSNRKQSGFTLIELLGVLTVMAILMAITIPSFRGVGKSFRLNSGVSAVAASLSLARQYAVLNNATVAFIVLEPDANGFNVTSNGVNDCLKGYAVYDVTSNRYLSAWTQLPKGVVFDYYAVNAISKSGLSVGIDNFLLGTTKNIRYPTTNSAVTLKFPYIEFTSDGKANGTLAIFLTEGDAFWPADGKIHNMNTSPDFSEYMLQPNGQTNVIIVHQHTGRLEIVRDE
ncbi:MAG: prepilin-type N-terminal cleavage/methylation domain-containing protein [Kiritimatiellae bacterium]|nr:prepilin-type N-terminal cleavage/methylation domain-containing protein [Kiritimatiellia bacterium]